MHSRSNRIAAVGCSRFRACGDEQIMGNGRCGISSRPCSRECLTAGESMARPWSLEGARIIPVAAAFSEELVARSQRVESMRALDVCRLVFSCLTRLLAMRQGSCAHTETLMSGWPEQCQCSRTAEPLPSRLQGLVGKFSRSQELRAATISGIAPHFGNTRTSSRTPPLRRLII